jgi:hypothetical protein
MELLLYHFGFKEKVLADHDGVRIAPAEVLTRVSVAGPGLAYYD